MTKPPGYYQGCNEALLKAVPGSARTILEVGCGEGRLGGRLKELNPERTVIGIDPEPSAAVHAGQQLYKTFLLNIESEEPPLEPHSLDCIIFEDVLEHLIEPEEVLLRFRRFLRPDGTILCSIPNVQHHSIIQALVKGDFQYAPEGLLDATHLRFFTYSTIIKLLLDAGFAPNIVSTIRVPCPQSFFDAALPLIRYLGLHPARTAHYLSACQYIVQGTLLPDFSEHEQSRENERPISFVACVSNEATLEANLLRSPCLAFGSPHELLLMRGFQNAADGLNRGVERAKNPIVVCLHQDVYLPRDWTWRFWQQYDSASRNFGEIGIAGVYGVRCQEGAVTRTGHVVDRDRLLWERPELPAQVDTLDELLLAVPKDIPWKFEPRLGFHFYGADICLAAQEQGRVAVALDALCYHNSPHVGVSPDFHASARAFTSKWTRRLPVATSCARIDKTGRIDLI